MTPLSSPTSYPSYRDVMLKPEDLDNCWRFECVKTLVRPEYKGAEEFVLPTATLDDALVVTGQHDICSSVNCSAIAGVLYQGNPFFCSVLSTASRAQTRTQVVSFNPPQRNPPHTHTHPPRISDFPHHGKASCKREQLERGGQVGSCRNS